MFEQSVARHSSNRMFGTKGANGTYKWVTYGEVALRVDKLRAGLAGLDVKKGDAVGIIANNRPEWAVVAFAAYGLGARFIPMYESELAHIWKYIISDGAVKVLFVANADIVRQLGAFSLELPCLKKIIVIDSEGPDSMDQLERVGKVKPVASLRPDPGDVSGLIYTSGTTGEPKGVLLTHGNFSSNVLAGIKMYPELGENDVTLAILPWAHSYAQTGELYAMIQLGASMGLVESPATIARDIQLVKPTWLIAVPRVFNRIYESISTKIEKEGGFTKVLFDMALEVAKRRRELSAKGQSEFLTDMKAKILDAVVFKKIRNKLGGRLKGSMTASAMMNLDIARFFSDVGIPVYDCYGMTETSPAISMNASFANRPGSVGKAIDKVRILIDKFRTGEDSPDGEIVVYGPNVMKGYHNKPDETEQVLTPDGGMRTGDRGRLDKDGYLFITGRIKEQFKLENGKFVFPAALEEDICLLSCVQNAVIYGDNRPYTVCMVVPEFDTLKEMASQNGIESGDIISLVSDERIINCISEKITGALKSKYGGYEIPRKILLLTEPFTVENGLLTQTLKLKRQIVLAKYMDKIESLYAKGRN